MPQALAARPAWASGRLCSLLTSNTAPSARRRSRFGRRSRNSRQLCGDVGWAAIHNIARLLDYFRERGWPVLYPHVSPKQSFDYGRLSDKVPAIMTVAAKGYEFVAEVAPREKDILLPKKHPSAFFGTPLASYLIEVGADTLVVTGCTTSGCVRGSVVDAFAYNFRVLVPEDAVYDRSATSHAVNLFDMASKYADVMPTGDALTALRAVG
jgi:maleamate amidohydrolase